MYSLSTTVHDFTVGGVCSEVVVHVVVEHVILDQVVITMKWRWLRPAAGLADLHRALQIHPSKRSWASRALKNLSRA